MGPPSMDVPPKMAINTGKKDSSGLNAIVGSMYRQRVAITAPAAPINIPLSANVSTLSRVTSMPICSAASSFSPMPCSAMP